MFRWDVEAALSNAGVSASASDDGTDPTFRLGCCHDVTDRVGLRVGWQRYAEISETDIDTYGLDLLLRF